jgi:trans-aconitate 2-methyltransferase
MTDWNPTLYSKFEAERMRAARDLLARVSLEAANLVYDLGCGPGNSAELLLNRFPHAKVVGLDTSDAMLAHARLRSPGARFVKGDIAHWAPDERADLIFANAALQFLPEHEQLFPRLMSYLVPGGALAVQMPNIARESSHALMRMVAAEGPWSQRLVPIAKTQPLIAGYEDYYDWLEPHASQVEVWMTTYVHPLDGPASIADWFAGSTLQPFLERLVDDERCEFLARYRSGLKDAYPTQPDGRTLFAYPRLFIVAVRAE